MKLTQVQYWQVSDCFLKHRGRLTCSNYWFNAFIYIAENGCKWRVLPEKYGYWHTICYRISHRAKNGVIDRAFAKLQKTQIVKTG
jgi:transposase